MAEALKANKISSDDKKALWLTLAVFIAYVVYSFFSRGFYQHDEIGHYFSMREFWNNPNVILGNSAKTGYKLIYVIPALLGNGFLVYLNSAITAFTCFLVFKIAKNIGSKFAWLAFFILALQPYWIQLSFRNYADTFSGFILATALLFHYKKKYITASLLLSFAGIVRQEFLLLLPVYGVWQALNKRWICFFLLGIFPLLNNIWGYLATGEPFYLFSSSAKTAARYADEWPRQGFDHYFKMGIVIWGAVQCFLLILFFLQFVSKRMNMFKQEDFVKDYPQSADRSNSVLFISVPFIIYFLIHCIFNWESVKIGAATGGNLRYMTAIAPLVALLGVYALDQYKYLSKKTLVWAGAAVYLTVVVLFLSYHHNNVLLLTEPDQQTGEPAEHDYTPVLFSLAAAICLLMIPKQKNLATAFIVVAVVFVIFTVRPFKQTPEDVTMEKITNSIIAKKYTDQNRTIFINHTLFKYFYEKKKHQIYKNQVYIDSLTLQNVPLGSIIVWESHYGYRPKLNKNAVTAGYFQRRPNQYTLLQNNISSDQRFQVVMFEKTGN
ncbi:MAG TPA: hypothetical protein VNY73_11385 [Bacteroidia bacterium]|jgi:hypothetical protein|nr:hypothetical protein [Bacteroidia bacterium]